MRFMREKDVKEKRGKWEEWRCDAEAVRDDDRRGETMN